MKKGAEDLGTLKKNLELCFHYIIPYLFILEFGKCCRIMLELNIVCWPGLNWWIFWFYGSCIWVFHGALSVTTNRIMQLLALATQCCYSAMVLHEFNWLSISLAVVKRRREVVNVLLEVIRVAEDSANLAWKVFILLFHFFHLLKVVIYG